MSRCSCYGIALLVPRGRTGLWLLVAGCLR